MEIETKLSELANEQDAIVNELASQRQILASRVSGFQSSLLAVNGDQSPSTLAFKRKLESKIADELESLKRVDGQITEAKAKQSAFEDALKILSKTGGATSPQKDLRSGSELFKVREIIRAAGKPLALDEILQKLGQTEDDKRDEKSRRISLRGSLRGYAKEGKFFTIEVAPDTFGLLEFNKEKTLI